MSVFCPSFTVFFPYLTIASLVFCLHGFMVTRASSPSNRTFTSSSPTASSSGRTMLQEVFEKGQISRTFQALHPQKTIFCESICQYHRSTFVPLTSKNKVTAFRKEMYPNPGLIGSHGETWYQGRARKMV